MSIKPAINLSFYKFIHKMILIGSDFNNSLNTYLRLKIRAVERGEWGIYVLNEFPVPNLS